jgi:hypothetical protein
MGYSPFRPHMSFSSGASSGTAQSAPAKTAGTAASTAATSTAATSAAVSPIPYPYEPPGEDGADPEQLAEEEVVAEGEVDDALAMILSLGTCYTTGWCTVLHLCVSSAVPW